jgi:hypothetical protein
MGDDAEAESKGDDAAMSGISIPILTTMQAIITGLLVVPLMLAIGVFFTRPSLRRIGGALAGGLAYAMGNWAWDRYAVPAGWWRYPIWGLDGALPPAFYLLVGGAYATVALIGWRVQRRYGWRGGVCFLSSWTVWGILHDYAGSALFSASNFMVLAPGAGPLLADAATYATCAGFGLLVMGFVAGPANAGRVAGSSNGLITTPRR